ncbi:hypothetical protein [Mycobacteroides abscessus]|uniref:hypothetical protein n=1 Tax=Mycobacteroides abscessus TaxID=36809 RepID=UPI0009CDC4CD|nr:hypothetical protein [Mycobacteroides abscessus]SLH38167.1 Uncharacterised protein [Mycobacteroides abscessus subsp. massiliense]
MGYLVEVSDEDLLAADWYIAVNERGINVLNRQPFSRVLHPNQCRYSAHWRGYTLHRHPFKLGNGNPLALWDAPWTVWRVQPGRIVSVGAPRVGDRLPERIYVRNFTSIEQMPEAFEFGSHGRSVHQLVNHLAALDAWPDELPSDGPVQPERTALHQLTLAVNDQSVETQGSVRLAENRLRFRMRHTQHYAETARLMYEQGRWEVNALLAATVKGLPIPESLRQRWNLPADNAAIDSDTDIVVAFEQLRDELGLTHPEMLTAAGLRRREYRKLAWRLYSERPALAAHEHFAHLAQALNRIRDHDSHNGAQHALLSATK